MELMRRVQADDDTRAFAELHDRHAASALRIARSVDHHPNRAEDSVQEGFLAVWRSRKSYRPELGSVRSWVMKIVRHRAIDTIRHDNARGGRPDLADESNVIHDTDPGLLGDDVVARNEGEALRAMLARLPDAQVEVITLAFFGELSHREIATQLSLPEGTVKGRMRLGLEKLRGQMQAAG